MKIPHRNCILLTVVVFVGLFPLLLGVSLGKENNYNSSNDIDTKCSFFDTVNVTGYPSFPNGSYSYEGTLIPSHYVETYDYIYKNLEDRIDVAPHIRGCICKLKPCVNACCPRGSIQNNGVCEENMNMELWSDPTINVTLNDGSIQNVNMYEQFVVQNFRPCTAMFFLIPEVNSFDAYQLFENGTLLREDDQIHKYKNEFCLVPILVNDKDLSYTIHPANWDEPLEKTVLEILTGYAMLFSVPFMLLTIAVYLLIPELRNEHGKSLVCYLLGLTIGYTILVWNHHIKGMDMNLSVWVCKLFGYIAYFFFMFAFFWLNVISFDLWHNFRESRCVSHTQKKKRFLHYSLYSWGLALSFLIFTVLIQECTDWTEEVKSGIGTEYCWLNMNAWSAMIYFYGPILIIILANTVMFIMTAFKIHGVQKEMAHILAKEGSAKNLRTEKDNFGLFLRLFLIMGVTWSSEIYSYFVGKDSKYVNIFYISEVCNALQGFLIFILFVLKKSVRRLISKRLFSVSRMLKNQKNKTNTHPSKAVGKGYQK